jgi:hypothetical protein
MTDLPTFTRTAAAMVAANDRRAWLRALVAALRVTGGRAALAWSALVIAAVVLVLLPVNMRAA